ncbi:unnamed protein product [Moneuplotes crassus]|uniref:Uncharacterized protein n=1 Tax=Euplotes crassus TaxID=5936 RepID=A0AAD2D2K2_EUPCR|nr:unnamed protein product [Moneuplotes crassus]
MEAQRDRETVLDQTGAVRRSILPEYFERTSPMTPTLTWVYASCLISAQYLYDRNYL